MPADLKTWLQREYESHRYPKSEPKVTAVQNGGMGVGAYRLLKLRQIKTHGVYSREFPFLVGLQCNDYGTKKYFPVLAGLVGRTYIYRVHSSVWRLPNYWPPTPTPPSECVLPRTKSGGVHAHRAVRGWGINSSEDARHWIGLLQYNSSTVGRYTARSVRLFFYILS